MTEKQLKFIPRQQASWLISMLKNGMYVVEVESEDNHWVKEEEGVC